MATSKLQSDRLAFGIFYSPFALVSAYFIVQGIRSPGTIGYAVVVVLLILVGAVVMHRRNGLRLPSKPELRKVAIQGLSVMLTLSVILITWDVMRSKMTVIEASQFLLFVVLCSVLAIPAIACLGKGRKGLFEEDDVCRGESD